MYTKLINLNQSQKSKSKSDKSMTEFFGNIKKKSNLKNEK